MCPQCRRDTTRSDRRQRAREDRRPYGMLVDGSRGTSSKAAQKKVSARPAIILILWPRPN